MSRTIRRAVCAGVAALATSLVAVSAHRVDELLQTARVTVRPDHITLDLYLTPGAAVVPALVMAIDRSADGQVSPDEARAYASAVLSHVSLHLDGVAVPLDLETVEYPDAAALAVGRGAIRLSAAAAVSRPVDGEHLVTLHNRFRTAESVYQANAMVSRDPAVTILGQARDAEQTRLTIRYRVEGDPPAWRGGRVATLGVISLIGLTLAVLWIRRT